MSTLFQIIFFALASFLFSFSLWRALKLDYPNEAIFTFSFLVIFGGVFVSFFSTFFQDFSFYASVLGAVMAGLWAAKRFKFRIFDLIDGIFLAWFLFLTASSLELLFRARLESLYLLTVYFVPPVLGIISYIIFVKGYRSFPFYPSGKIGFAGLASAGIFFLARAVAFYIVGVLPLKGNFGWSVGEITDISLSVILFLICLLAVYLRSGRKFAQRIIEWQKE